MSETVDTLAKCFKDTQRLKKEFRHGSKDAVNQSVAVVLKGL